MALSLSTRRYFSRQRCLEGAYIWSPYPLPCVCTSHVNTSQLPHTSKFSSYPMGQREDYHSWFLLQSGDTHANFPLQTCCISHIHAQKFTLKDFGKQKQQQQQQQFDFRFLNDVPLHRNHCRQSKERSSPEDTREFDANSEVNFGHLKYWLSKNDSI